MVATGGQELISDVAAVLAFALNVTWTTDFDLMRRLVPAALSGQRRRGPASQVQRTFDPQVLLTDDDIADAAAFSTRLLALSRADYERAIRAVRGVVDATLLIADDVTLAYTLFVAAIESLAVTASAPPTTWDAFDGRKRRLIESALEDLSEPQADRVRSAVLEADALGLSRKFRAFALDHVQPSFYRAEAVGALRPIRAEALPHALDFAYRVRSRQVHALEQLVPEMWAMTDRADAITIDSRQVLSLEGLNRLCRHVIRRYVERASTDLDGAFNYRTALPGIVRMPLAPQYWIAQAGGLLVDRAPAVFHGFLEVLLPLLRGDSKELPVDMTDVLERVEKVLPGEASAAKRRPLLALYLLWHRLVPPEFHRPSPDAILDRFLADFDESPNITTFAVGLILDIEVPWTIDELEDLVAERVNDLSRGRGQPLPVLFDAALHLTLARELWKDGRAEDALRAVGRAVETVPGDAKLIAFEEQANADRDHAAGLGTLDVRRCLLTAGPDTAGPDTAGPDAAGPDAAGPTSGE
jgi:hypothetical protein